MLIGEQIRSPRRECSQWLTQRRSEPGAPDDGVHLETFAVDPLAGLLKGRTATTHWASLNLLSELDPTVMPDVAARFVDDGDLITSAGVSAGIDMALHLVVRLAGVERAREVRRAIQYDPHPPI